MTSALAMPALNQIDGGFRSSGSRQTVRLAIGAGLALGPAWIAGRWLRRRQ